MTVYCELDTCKYNHNCECNRGVVSLDCDGECQDFENLYDDPEWQKPYWKRLIDQDTKQVYRVLFRGNKIELKGLSFFVDANSDYALATEETTGLNVGQRCDLEGCIDKIIDAIAKCVLPPLDLLPIGEYDEKTRRVIPKQDEKEGE